MVRPVITQSRSSTGDNSLTQTTITSFFQSKDNSTNRFKIKPPKKRINTVPKNKKKSRAMTMSSSPIVIVDSGDEKDITYPIKYEIDTIDFELSLKKPSCSSEITVKQENLMVLNFSTKNVSSISSQSADDTLPTESTLDDIDFINGATYPVTSTPFKENELDDTLIIGSASNEEELPSSNDTIPFDFDKDLTITITPIKKTTKVNIISDTIINTPGQKRSADEAELESPSKKIKNSLTNEVSGGKSPPKNTNTDLPVSSSKKIKNSPVSVKKKGHLESSSSNGNNINKPVVSSKKTPKKNNSTILPDSSPNKVKLSPVSVKKSGSSFNGGSSINKSAVTSPKKSPSKRANNTLSSTSKARKKLNFKKEEDKDDGKLNIYYVEEFLKMIKFVISNSNTNILYSKTEKIIIKHLCEISQEYQYFCFKLFMHLPKWYNIYSYCNKINLKLSDVEVNTMFNTLKQQNLIDTDYTRVQLPELLKEVSSPGLKEICKSLKINIKGINKKEDLAVLLLKTSTTQATLNGLQSFPDRIMYMIKKNLGYCVQLKKDVRDLLNKVYVMCTYTNSDLPKPQDYFRFKSNSSNVLPTYDIEENFSLFYSKSHFDRFLEAKLLMTLLMDALDLQAKYKDRRLHNLIEVGRKAYKYLREETGSNEHSLYKQYPHLKYFTAQSMYIKILTECAVHVTPKYHSEAKIWLEFLIEQNYIYESRKCGMWYNQLALIYMRYLSDYESAAKTILSGFDEKENMSDIVLEDLGMRGRRVKDSKAYKISTLYHDEIIAKGPEPPDADPFPEVRIDAVTVTRKDQGVGMRKVYVVNKSNGDKDFLNVESVALNYYGENGYPKGFHCEGILLNGLFMLYFYDIIYDASIKGVFISKLQMYPLDLYSSYFYENRKEKIEKRLNDILEWSDLEVKEFIVKIFNTHNHEKQLLSFDSFMGDQETLLQIIFCIGKKLLVKIFRRFLSNLRDYRSGLPDLFIYNSETKKCKFVEVKSDNDKLSTKQKFWLKYLREYGADTEICHVHALGTKKKLLKGEKIKKNEKITPKKQKQS